MTAQLAAPAISTQTWTWQGHQIHYAVQGTGQPLVLVHGFGACIGHWRKNIPVLAAAGYRVFALDLLGFGASDKPKLDYRLEIWQELLQDFWSAFIQEPAIFIGNSMGGLITLMMLAHHPDISAGGVLLNSAGGLNMNMRDDEQNVVRRILMGGINTLIASKRLGPSLFNRVRTKQRIRGSLSQVYRNPEAITDELVDMIHAAAATPGAQEAFASIMTAPAGPRPSELLPSIEKPLLVLWGENDPWAALPTADIYRLLSEEAETQVTFKTIPNTGHCPHDERPEVVNPLIIDWLSQL
ncbi:alpha/beta fold hydrolase [Acaryochloris thomasi]|uniref:alpha/beta fold hydrolase n=1 Tax=Acaryochloris thomasi TaxID=2929456 RepID=UPI000DA65C2D|nr:alpha/beta fold hydrolase [Acaryochloris thomasi]